MTNVSIFSMIFFNQTDVNPLKTAPFLNASFDYDAKTLTVTRHVKNTLTDYMRTINTPFAFQRASFKNFTEMVSLRFNVPLEIILVDIGYR